MGLVPQPRDNVKYMVRIKRTVAYERLVLLCVGLTLFFAAPRMARWVRERGRDFVSSPSCRSVTLFYGAGISIGIVASLLILLYMFGKFVPKVSNTYLHTIARVCILSQTLIKKCFCFVSCRRLVLLVWVF